MRKVWVLLAVFLLAASAPGAALAAGVPIDAAHFPDTAFIVFVREHDTNSDGILSPEEIEAAKSMIVKPDFGAKNLKGIEYFTYLETLVCSNLELTSLDLSGNKKLTSLHCANNLLTSLDLSENTELKTLHCENNNALTSLNVSRNTKLETLNCTNNPLTTLDVSKNTALKDLACSGNALTSLDVSQNTALTELTCYSNALTTLDLSKNTELSTLHCANDQLMELNVSKNTKLFSLNCASNDLKALDLSQNTRLSTLNCTDNRLTSLDLSQNTELSTLNCTNNRLTSLDLSQNTRLDSLYCGGNRLTFLDLQGLPLTSSATVGGQTRDGLILQQRGDKYEANLGTFIPREGFIKVTRLAGLSGGMSIPAVYDSTSGKATFDAEPEKVTYRYVTSNDKAPLMDVTLIVGNVITVSVSGRGRVTHQGSTEALSGDVVVSKGKDATFVVSADAGYAIASLRVDDAPVSVPLVATRYEYTFRNVTENHTLRVAFKARPGGSPGWPGGSPSNPGGSPDKPDVPPTSPDVPPVNPPASVDIPASAGQWTVFWGTPDAQGNVEVTVQVPIKSEVPLVEGSIRVDALGIEGIRVKLLPDGPAASAHAMAQQYSYLLQITGTVAENAMNTARIDALHYRLAGSSEEKTVRLGTNGGGILLKDMRKGQAPKSDSGGGCDAGFSGLMLAFVGAFLLRKKA